MDRMYRRVVASTLVDSCWEYKLSCGQVEFRAEDKKPKRLVCHQCSQEADKKKPAG
jgi:hypothetical protein